MRVLLLHPDDAFHGSWTRQHWDSVIDLGRAPKSFYDERSAALGCPVFSVFDLAVEIEDMQIWRHLLELGMGRVVDGFGIDWWDVISVLLQPEMQDVRLVLRLAEKLSGCRTLAVSRPSVTAEALRLRLGIPLQVFHRGLQRRLVRGVLRRGRAVANLNFEQLRQVVYDKYDPHYVWRRKLAGRPAQSSKWKSESEPVVLLPSAYSSVTKTALSYARILPEQKFLLVLARESAAVSPVPANVQAASLAGFAAKRCDRNELQKREVCWKQMERSLEEDPAFRLPVQLGILKKGLRWLRWGLAVRDAWIRVFETRSVVGCLSADDSNPIYADSSAAGRAAGNSGSRVPSRSTRLPHGIQESAVFELSGQRRDGAGLSGTHLRSRCRPDSRGSGKTVVLKLHPFESARQRLRLVKRILSEDDRKLVSVTDAPLSHEILQKTWCAVTVGSTVAFECASVGIPVSAGLCCPR